MPKIVRISLSNLPDTLKLDLPIERVDWRLDEEVGERLVSGRRPIVLDGGASHWPAVSKWSFAYLASLGGETEVQVEQGNIMQERSSFRGMAFREFLDQVEGGELSCDRDFLYLASLELFTMIPALKQDVDFNWFKKHFPIHFPFAWIGPTNTVSGYHYDTPDNVIVMVKGRKLIHVVPPEQTPNMYPSRKWDYGAKLSEVDALRYDPERHPLFAGVQPLSVILEPGDALYIPRYWWHHIVSLEPSISVNCFAYGRLRFLLYEAREASKALLHRAGLYATTDCTCHQWVEGTRIPKPGKHPFV